MGGQDARASALAAVAVEHVGSMLREQQGPGRWVTQDHPNFPSAAGYLCAPGELWWTRGLLVGVFQSLLTPWGMLAAGSIFW